MADESPRLGLPYVRAGQLQKHVTVNEAMTRLDALVQTAIQTRSLSTPPAVADEGSIYWVGPNPTGAWSGYATGTLVVAEFGQWRALRPVAGQMAQVMDEAQVLVFTGTQWQPLGEWLGRSLRTTHLGIGTAPDANNPFIARLNSALCTAIPRNDGGTGSVRFSLNKQAAADTASLLFQTNGQGQGEIGLTGDQDLRLKVSADGTQWSEAFRVERTDGRVWFARGAVRTEQRFLTSSGTLTFPDWVRRIDARCVGAGGGGAAGQYGSSGVRRGGGGGGGGGVTHASWTRESIGNTITYVAGAGGTAGDNSDGGHGGATEIKSGVHTVLRASGGQGGRMDGSGGAAGMGMVAANGGGHCDSAGTAHAAVLMVAIAPGGGGAGGGLTAANVAEAGSAATHGGAHLVAGPGGVGGNGGPGISGSGCPLPNLNSCSGGGGGGGARATAAGYWGGTGANYGGGGGGGGAGSYVGGAGGGGGGGIILLTLIG